MPKNLLPKIYELKQAFPKGSVGQEMTANFPMVFPNYTVAETLDLLKKEINSFETITYVFVIDEDSRLVGVVTIKELFRAAGSQKITDLMEKKLVKALPWTHEENVVLLALKHNIKYIPVVDSQNHLLGIFTTHSLREFLNRQIERKLLRASGVRWKSVFEMGAASIWQNAVARLPWIFVGVLGGLLSAGIIALFRSTLEAVIVLAFYIPVIMSTGANMANQSAMIFIRNLMSGNIRTAGGYFFREAVVGLFLGLSVSVILFFIIISGQGSLVVALAVALSSLITIILSALIGVLIPYVLNSFKVDPTMGAGPFLTTVKDVVSIFIYFSVAALIISALK